MTERLRVREIDDDEGRRLVRVTCTLTTHDPDEAAAEAERLLAGWAWIGQKS